MLLLPGLGLIRCDDGVTLLDGAGSDRGCLRYRAGGKIDKTCDFLHSLGPLTMNVFGCFGYSLVDFTTIVSRSGLLFGKSRDSVTEALPRTTSPVWTNHFL